MRSNHEQLAHLMAALLAGKLDATAEEIEKAKRLAQKIQWEAKAPELTPIEVAFRNYNRPHFRCSCPQFIIEATQPEGPDGEWEIYELPLQGILKLSLKAYRLPIPSDKVLFRLIRLFLEKHPAQGRVLLEGIRPHERIPLTSGIFRAVKPLEDSKTIAALLSVEIQIEKMPGLLEPLLRLLNKPEIIRRVKAAAGGAKGGRGRREREAILNSKDEARLKKAARIAESSP